MVLKGTLILYKKGLINCDICEASFNTSTDTTRNRYLCDHCENDFAKENYLQTHIKIEHLGETKKHQCEICNNEYNLNWTHRRG